jgi:hypothetical protein
MNVNDEILIRNCAGKLKVRLDKQLNINDVQRGLGHDRLSKIEEPRLEFHKGKRGWLITLYDSVQDEKKLSTEDPAKMTLVFVEDYCDEPEIWSASFSEAEQDEYIYETFNMGRCN